MKKILIVEDEKSLSHALELKFSNLGFQTTVSGNGEDALKALKQSSFDIILLDLMMPQMDGFAVLTEIQKQQIKTPVIVTSNLSQTEDISRAKNLGAKSFIVKSDSTIQHIVDEVQHALI